jgi:hypothetical protein
MHFSSLALQLASRSLITTVFTYQSHKRGTWTFHAPPASLPPFLSFPSLPKPIPRQESVYLTPMITSSVYFWSPASYRFLEVLSAGAIPVLIADDYVRPFESLIQWERCLLQFSTHDLHRILTTLRSLPKEDVVDRQCYCQQVFANFLQDDSTLVRSVILSLQQRMSWWATRSLPTLPIFWFTQ